MTFLQELPEVGEKLTVEITTSNLKSDFPSQLLEALNYTEFIISGPLNKNTIIPLNIGTNLTVKYYKKNKGRFRFEAQIVGRNTEDIYKIKIFRNSEIFKVQDREFFRLPVMLDVNKTKNSEFIESEEAFIEECITEDISGGGLRILCNHNHEIGELIICKININGKMIKFSGEVVRKDSEIINKEFEYSLGVKFNNIIDKNREKIVKYVFDKQRIHRKKGLI